MRILTNEAPLGTPYAAVTAVSRARDALAYVGRLAERRDSIHAPGIRIGPEVQEVHAASGEVLELVRECA